MESKQVKQLLEKYFEGQTSIAEEKQLKAYFSSEDVAPDLVSYQPMFANFRMQREEQFTKALPLQPRKHNHIVKWIGIAASFVVLFGVLQFYFSESPKEDLGTFNSPEEAFVATQKALDMVSNSVNQGVESVAVLKEYEKTKKTIFKE
ncbi:hypothetical protein DI487_02385 [Flavobacterium sediminis]|uniref:Uncharacterized protein n=1 Tax=Flavobacterium sediminis TaxID=2201181 RepID=A0A2U8QRP2_9FLAO|nr:hypothetical protein [Flavobacterium sediminis]AWM12830.1 hypothetical protein DI487_02385 [Flavobacterium sediminis]